MSEEISWMHYCDWCGARFAEECDCGSRFADPETACVVCGEPDSMGQCVRCGSPLCYRHEETCAGFCMMDWCQNDRHLDRAMMERFGVEYPLSLRVRLLYAWWDVLDRLDWVKHKAQRAYERLMVRYVDDEYDIPF